MYYFNFRKPGLLSASLSVCLIALFILAQCTKDDDPPARDKFLGTYSVVETCGSGNSTYQMQITASSTSDNAVLITNNEWDVIATATVSGNTITIPSQILDAVNISGSGSISGNTLTLSYTISESGYSDNCTAICNKL